MNGLVNRKSRAGAGFAAAALAVVIAVLAGCSGGGSPAPEADLKKPARANLAQGKDIYFRYCHFCHGRTGYGDGPVGIALSPHPANFVEDRKRMAKTDDEMFKSITEGVHKDIGGEAMSMPRWQEILTEEERWNVLAYIRHLEKEGLKAMEAEGRGASAVTEGSDEK
ncbi:MAG: cytochrome c [Deltaproteobacteria bacterium]|nr:cytochrome c [Deltaproteobacteria bacterium]MBZ0220071.1 cytochrome c [Deltaproteobacteria bacterium]